MAYCDYFLIYMTLSKQGHAINPDEETVEIHKHALSRPGALKAILTYYSAYYQYPITSYHISAPMLHIKGENDLLFFEDLIAEDLKANVDNIEFRTLEHGKHFSLDHLADPINRMIEDFLKVKGLWLRIGCLLSKPKKKRGRDKQKL